MTVKIQWKMQLYSLKKNNLQWLPKKLIADDLFCFTVIYFVIGGAGTTLISLM